MKRKMKKNKANRSSHHGSTLVEPDQSETNTSSEGERESDDERGGAGDGDNINDGIDGSGSGHTTDSYEEECVICLDVLSSAPWGRCTPCNHAFHKECWWEWENAHNERVAERRQRQGRRGAKDEGPKCCLCNTVNECFVDGTGEPAHNPSPFIASEDPGGEGSGNRFTNWFREVGEEASGFMEFLANDLRETANAAPFPFQRSHSNRDTNTSGRGRGGRNSRRSSNTSPNRSRIPSFVPPIFGSRRRSIDDADSPSGSDPNGARSSSNRNEATPPFTVPPLFRSLSEQLTGQQQPWASTWPSSYPNTNTNSNPFNQIRPGTRIITQHLVNSPHLNGRHGTILHYQTQSSRYLVQLEANISNFIGGDSTAPVAIKPENLLQTGVKVKIHGLHSQPRLNGKEGTVSAYSKERNRYIVQLNPSLLSTTAPREISIQPINIRIPNGMCVRLEGLQRTPQWNGKYGTIVGWVEDESGMSGSGRYEVRLSRQYAVRVKMENVRL
mmetsp:Transcript_5757/g.12568  ORF Transcript_5757/g.12568 Transcript_5757/m.12568 type:complete len:499 (+) Transcript_5757:20-1516(+)